MSNRIVTVYTSPGPCVQCKATERWLTERGIEFEVVSLDDIEPALMDEFRGLGYLQAPVVNVAIDGQRIVRWWGFDPFKLEEYAQVGHE